MTAISDFFSHVSADTLPVPLRPETLRVLEQIRTSKEVAELAMGEPTDSHHLLADSLLRVAASSEYVSNQWAQNPRLIIDLCRQNHLAHGYDNGQLQKLHWDWIIGADDHKDLQRRMRQVRHREMVRIAWRDLAGCATVDETLRDTSNLACLLINTALHRWQYWLAGQYGYPTDPCGGAPIGLTVLGMGKLGAGELNFSSDIDLIFAYPHSGETDGESSISHQEYFTKLGRRLIQALDENTEHGRAFRVDMRLRPFGNDGPLVSSYDALEQYYEVHGREWERYALIKAVPVTGSPGEQLMRRLRPFVYRRYLDFGVIDSIRDMKIMIRQEAARKGLDDNIKLGTGGIREAEFFVQAHQLIQGGKHPDLQCAPLKQAVGALVQWEILTAGDADDLLASYDFLRRVENHLQMARDRQTHDIPASEPERSRLAFSMGFPDWEAFDQELVSRRRLVQSLFEELLEDKAGKPAEKDADLAGLWKQQLTEKQTTDLLRHLGFRDAATAASVLATLRHGPHYKRASSVARERLDELMPQLIAACSSADNPDRVLPLLCNFLDVVITRSAYLVLLHENPQALQLLIQLFGLSTWVSNWITRHPLLLDELLHPRTLYNPPEAGEVRKQLANRLGNTPVDDLEQQMNILREVRHGNLLRVASAHLINSLSVRHCSELLSGLAEQLLVTCLGLAVDQMTRKFGKPLGDAPENPPALLLVAYGRLGSREMGFGSDLDLVFLHNNEKPSAMTDGSQPIANETWFMRLAQRVVHLITTSTTAGKLYEVDLRLRPGGNAGPPASNIDALEKYLHTEAWTWEHQALIKARAISGPADLVKRFNEIRAGVLRQERNPETLRQDIWNMRERVYQHKKPATHQFHLKQSRGGLVDIEFLSQYLVLRHAARHPALTELRSTDDIITRAGQLGLLGETEAGHLSRALADCLSLEQQATLRDEEPLSEDPAMLAAATHARRIFDQLLHPGETTGT